MIYDKPWETAHRSYGTRTLGELATASLAHQNTRLGAFFVSIRLHHSLVGSSLFSLVLTLKQTARDPDGAFKTSRRSGGAGWCKGLFEKHYSHSCVAI